MQKTTYNIPGMDCPAEEALIKVRLGDISTIQNMEFNLEKRVLIVFHLGQSGDIDKALSDLDLGSKRIDSISVDETETPSQQQQRIILITVLAINFSFFVIEIIAGWLSGSMGLSADSLDMLADAFVYGLSLFAVGGNLSRKKAIANVAGYFQLALAGIGFGEVIRRFIGADITPDYQTMILVSAFALAANASSLFLLQKSKSRETHIQASMIFTSNDVIINAGVIAAGILVNYLNSNIPDLVIGTIVFLVVFRGALRILKLGK